MGSKERREAILEILEREGHVTVKHLTDALHYSSATVNRDLNALQAEQRITRSYGGAELLRTAYVPVFRRAHTMREEKMWIGEAAAREVCDGDTIFIDGSTTSQCMEQHLIGRRDLCVITNNIVLAANLSAYGVRVICLGGEIVESPSMLYGPESVENAARYRVDKMFFSVNSVTPSGAVGTSHYLLHRVLLNNSREAYLLTDRAKLSDAVKVTLCDFSRLAGVISDIDFPEETKQAYPAVRFIQSADGKI